MSTTVLNNILISVPHLNMAERSENDLKIFGKRLREIRKSKNLSMQMLANISELERVQISRIELGKTNPKLSTIYTLAKALNVNPKEFFEVK